MNRLLPKPVFKSAWVYATALLLAFSVGLSAQESTTPEATPEAKPAKPPSLSNKWRMEVSGNAKSAGIVVMKFTPKGGEPIVAEVAIADKAGENDVAKALVKGLKAQLPKKQFHIERDDGEDVLVKKKYGAPDFAFELVSSTVEHTRFRLQKE